MFAQFAQSDVLTTSGEVVTRSPWPLVVTIAVLVALFLLTESVRLVGRGERLVVRRGGAKGGSGAKGASGTTHSARLAGPGLVLVTPFVEETRRIRVTPVDRRVVAPGPGAPHGGRLVLVVRVVYRVVDPAVHASDESAWRAVQLATRRAALRLPAPQGSEERLTSDDLARLRRRVTHELEDLGMTVEHLAVERTFFAPEVRLTSTAGASSS